MPVFVFRPVYQVALFLVGRGVGGLHSALDQLDHFPHGTEADDLVLDEIEECIPSGMNVETKLDAKELGASINRFL